jgi:hypothetical protein
MTPEQYFSFVVTHNEIWTEAFNHKCPICGSEVYDLANINLWTRYSCVNPECKTVITLYPFTHNNAGLIYQIKRYKPVVSGDELYDGLFFREDKRGGFTYLEEL